MYEKTASGQGKNCLKALEGTILGAYTRMGIVPIPHQPDDNNNNDNNKKTSKFIVHQEKKEFYFNSLAKISLRTQCYSVLPNKLKSKTQEEQTVS